MTPPPIVLVVDGDLGFLFALSHELHYHAIDSLPALTIGEARSMLMHLRLGSDLVVINCAVLGACTFARYMANLRPSILIIGIVSEGNQCEDCADLLKATFRAPEAKDPERIPYCANVIEALVRGRRSDTWQS